MYDLFKFLHVLAAVVWVGSGFGLIALTLVMARDRAATAAVAPYMDKLGQRLFGPSAVLTLIFGIVTVVVSDGAVRFSDPWIAVGFGGFVLSGIVTMMAAPATRKLGELTAEKGHDHPDVAAAGRKVTSLHSASLVILVVVIAAMVFKPG